MHNRDYAFLKANSIHRGLQLSQQDKWVIKSFTVTMVQTNTSNSHSKHPSQQTVE
ncbi:hypothetical protein SynPROS91_00636 [Synechococcus sp. PROS-9-1]|nr:hypothetical protein SynPROS91_00636 [Synechococcus sp. PROS-9-1]